MIALHTSEKGPGKEKVETLSDEVEIAPSPIMLTAV
jgi:hypothetical protein